MTKPGPLGGFEVFERSKRGDKRRGMSPSVSLAPGRLALSLNAAAFELLDQARAVTLLFDPAHRIIGLRAATIDDPGAYAIGAKSHTINAKAFAQHYGLQPFYGAPATMLNGILQIIEPARQEIAQPDFNGHAGACPGEEHDHGYACAIACSTCSGVGKGWVGQP